MPQEPPVADRFCISFHPVPAPGRTDLRRAEARRKFRAATQGHGRTNVSQLEDSLASTAKLENPQRAPRGQQPGHNDSTHLLSLSLCQALVQGTSPGLQEKPQKSQVIETKRLLLQAWSIAIGPSRTVCCDLTGRAAWKTECLPTVPQRQAAGGTHSQAPGSGE